MFDGQVFNLTTETTSFLVKRPVLPGFDEVEIVHELSVHGDVIARSGGRVLVRRIAGWDDVKRPDAIKQHVRCCSLGLKPALPPPPSPVRCARN